MHIQIPEILFALSLSALALILLPREGFLTLPCSKSSRYMSTSRCINLLTILNPSDAIFLLSSLMNNSFICSHLKTQKNIEYIIRSQLIINAFIIAKLYTDLYCSFIISSVHVLFHKLYYLQLKMGYSLI